MNRGSPLYPSRYLGRWIERRVQQLIDSRRDTPSQSAVARMLGIERTKFHGWINGRTHPGDDDSIATLARIAADPEVAQQQIRDMIHLDLLDAFMIDSELSADDLVLLVARLARRSGRSLDDVARALAREHAEPPETPERPRGSRNDKR